MLNFSFEGYGGPQVSHQIQILTSNTNSPHQKQIPHIKIKFTTSNTNSPQQKQNRHSKNKFTTSKTNLSQQKQIPHIKNESLTSKSKTQIKRSAVNERKLSPVFTRPSPDRHFVLVILNILPHELKFSLKIPFMVLAIISKWQASNGNIFLVIRKKVI